MILDHCTGVQLNRKTKKKKRKEKKRGKKTIIIAREEMCTAREAF
jgi:hypothetical protein